MSRYIQVATTIDKKKKAELLARRLLEQRLVACVQITACDSIYHWQGRIEQGSEYLCLMKTRADLLPMLEEAIKELHSYEVPEILATPILSAGTAYRQWLEKELAGKE